MRFHRLVRLKLERLGEHCPQAVSPAGRDSPVVPGGTIGDFLLLRNKKYQIPASALAPSRGSRTLWKKMMQTLFIFGKEVARRA